MTYDQIIYNSADGVALIKFNRPERLNALTAHMAAEIRDAVYKAKEDNAVRVIILTGEGRGFCAGADMAELEDASNEGISRLKGSLSAEEKVSAMTGIKTEEELLRDNPDNIRPDFRKRYSYLQAIPKPIIAAVNGPAAGLGLVISLYSDLRFASERARFSTAFSRRGLVAEQGVSWMLPRIIGLANALDLLFSSRVVDAEEACRIGLVNKVVPEDSFMHDVLTYAKDIAKSVSPRSLRVIKKQVYEDQFRTLAEASIVADEELIASLGSEDFKEGVAHFIEKRPPAFTGD